MDHQCLVRVNFATPNSSSSCLAFADSNSEDRVPDVSIDGTSLIQSATLSHCGEPASILSWHSQNVSPSQSSSQSSTNEGCSYSNYSSLLAMSSTCKSYPLQVNSSAASFSACSGPAPTLPLASTPNRKVLQPATPSHASDKNYDNTEVMDRDFGNPNGHRTCPTQWTLHVSEPESLSYGGNEEIKPRVLITQIESAQLTVVSAMLQEMKSCQSLAFMVQQQIEQVPPSILGAEVPAPASS